MADGSKRGSRAIEALRAGSIIAGDGGGGGGENPAAETAGKSLEGKRDSGTGTGTIAAGTSAASPAAIFGTRTAEDFKGLGGRPVYGIHPKSGDQVEIDWTQEGASPEAPFGLLADGTPRVKRARKPKGAGSSAAAKSGESVSVIADAIRFAHMGIATALKQPHWQQSEDEAARYADALTDLQSAYGFDIDPKQAAWAKLLTVVAIPTSARIMASVAIAKRKPEVAANPPTDKQPTSTVIRKVPESRQETKPASGSPQMSPSQLFASFGASFTDDTNS